MTPLNCPTTKIGGR